MSRKVDYNSRKSIYGSVGVKMEQVQTLYREWLHADLPDYLASELQQIAGDEAQINDRFYQYVAFGTGGMRGLLGVGTNRMNIYTVRRAAYGLAKYIVANGEEAMSRGVVIAYDTRYFSHDFAVETARVLGAYGVRSYVFREPRPTPELSFAVRHLQAFAGVVITASHNPRDYNGFKVYGEDGSQLTPNGVSSILQYMHELACLFDVPVADFEVLLASDMSSWILHDIDYTYQQQLLRLRSNVADRSLPIVYTPLHGAGIVPVAEGLRAFGFTNVHIVEEQAMQDGAFPTVPYPNPEEADAFKMAIKLGTEVGAQVLLATDPDADRLGVAVWDGTQYRLLTGNQLGALLLHYVLKTKQAFGTLPANGVMVKTIVTSELGTAVAKSFGVPTVNTLTGFKYIAEQIAQFERTGERTYVFGYEESYGYLIESFVRDKDAVQVALVTAEMAADYSQHNQTLLDALEMLYKEHGYYLESLVSKTFMGMEGQQQMTALLDELRVAPPRVIAGVNVCVVEDYLWQQAVNMATGDKIALTLPKENVLKFILEDGSWIAVRPSGTEPKCKYYFGVVTNAREASTAQLEALKQAMIGR